MLIHYMLSKMVGYNVENLLFVLVLMWLVGRDITTTTTSYFVASGPLYYTGGREGSYIVCSPHQFWVSTTD